MSERAKQAGWSKQKSERMSKGMSEWSSTYVGILGCSEPQCSWHPTPFFSRALPRSAPFYSFSYVPASLLQSVPVSNVICHFSPFSAIMCHSTSSIAIQRYPLPVNVIICQSTLSFAIQWRHLPFNAIICHSTP